MAKITDLVKTYRILSDPNAPDWNVKFIGALTIGAIVVAAGAGALFWAMSHDAPSATPAAVASEQETPAEEGACAASTQEPTIPTKPAARCAEPPPAILP